MRTPSETDAASTSQRSRRSGDVDSATFQLPEALEAELHELGAMIDRFKSGAVSGAQFRAVRVPQGIYEQRESGTYMLRMRFPAGGVLPHQLRRLAEVATVYGNGTLHVTSRQDIQVHRVALEAIYPALLSLLEAGLSTKGGGGNTVRNITACAETGVCADEVFDVAPYAAALTERLLPDRLSFELPRKYKIAFSACSRDCAGATVNDLGFIARRQNGREEFAVYAGGGLGAKSRVADRLEEFVPAADSFLVAEAVKRVFDKNGDRKNKHQARLRFLVERIGLDVFRQLYREELDALRASAPAPLAVRPFVRRETKPLNGEGGMRRAESSQALPTGDRAGYDRWARTNIKPQRQAGFFLVEIPVPLGDLSAEKMTGLATVVEAHGEGVVFATQAQNLVLRGVGEAELPVVHAKLAALGLADPQPPVLRHLVSCAGASTCRLGICQSRGLARAIAAALRDSGLELDRVGDLRIQVSGCPNSCGRHPVADLGFSGAARRVGDRLVPHYTVHVGGRVAEGQTRLATGCGTVPARGVPGLVVELVRVYLESGQAPDFQAFLAGAGRRMAEALVARHRAVPAFAEDSSFYCDWDADTLFSMAGRGAGECSAGVFDLIEMDLTGAREALAQGRGYTAVALAARSLLVTRGVQPKDDAEAFALFQEHFVAEGLVDRRFEALIATAGRSAARSDREQVFAGAAGEVASLVAAVRLLYAGMDNSLRCKPAAVDKS